MSILGKLTGVIVKTALTPIAVVKDVVNVATGQEASATKKHIDSAIDDLEKFADGMCGEDV